MIIVQADQIGAYVVDAPVRAVHPNVYITPAGATPGATPTVITVPGTL